MPANLMIMLSICIPAALLVIAVVNDYREGERLRLRRRRGF
jgi:hypothetical protein